MSSERFPILSDAGAPAESSGDVDAPRRKVPFAGNVLMSTLGCSKNLVDSEGHVAAGAEADLLPVRDHGAAGGGEAQGQRE